MIQLLDFRKLSGFTGAVPSRSLDTSGPLVRWGVRLRTLLFAALIVGGASLGVPRVSHAASWPRFGALSLSEGAETTSTQADTTQAVVKPEGLRTEYEFWLEGPREQYFCQIPTPCAPVKLIGSGHIEPDVGEEKVAADAIVVDGDHFYAWWVIARNADGETSSDSSVFETPLPLPVNEINVYKPESAGGAEWAQRSSELRVAEYQAAQKAKAEQEQAAREATERAAQAVRLTAAAKCFVPSLIGHTLAGARRLLALAHCKLGRVSYVRRHDKTRTNRVATQNPTRGTHVAAGASVSVRLVR